MQSYIYPGTPSKKNLNTAKKKNPIPGHNCSLNRDCRRQAGFLKKLVPPCMPSLST